MKKLMFAASIGTTIVSAAAGAQTAPDSAGGKSREISRQQAQQIADRTFERFDVNHDGTVTRDEAEQARAQRPQDAEGKGGARAEKMIDRLFGASQSLTKNQFESKALAHFDEQDTNRDGLVTSAERRQSHATPQAPQ